MSDLDTRHRSPGRTVFRVVALTAFLALTAPGGPRARGQDPNDPAVDLNRVWLFAVGVEKYSDPAFPTTRYCGDDAAAVVKIYKDIARLPDRRIKAFVGDETRPVNAAEVRAAFDQFIEQVGARDTLIVFFSGHGALDPEGNYVLATSDCRANNLAETGLGVRWLRDRLADCRAASKVVLLNACYSGAFDPKLPRKVDPQAAVNALKIAPDTVALSSSAQDAASFEIDEYKAGLFSHWVQVGLRGYANQRIDNAIDADELFRYVSEKVDKKADQLGLRAQTPVFGTAGGLTTFPRVIPLLNPERPSLVVATVTNFPLPINENVAGAILRGIPLTKLSKPRKAIGMCKLIIERLGADSPSGRQAQAVIEDVEQEIRAGHTRLEPPDRDD